VSIRYVYHKVKGDRFEGPSYQLLCTYSEKTLAEGEAFVKSAREKLSKKNSFHSIVVRKTKAPEHW
jgi:hypothetical protein